MSGTVLTVVASIAVVSVVALTFVVLLLVRRLKELTRRLGDVQRRLGPTLAGISHEARVAEHQLRRVTASPDRGTSPEA